IQQELTAHGWSAATELLRWHEEAEDWEPADTRLPHTPAEQDAEHARLMRHEDEETKAQGFADWEVRVQFPSHAEATATSAQLDSEGVHHVRHWKYLLIGAEDEDAARAWADRMKREAPEDADVKVEGTF